MHFTKLPLSSHASGPVVLAHSSTISLKMPIAFSLPEYFLAPTPFKPSIEIFPSTSCQKKNVQNYPFSWKLGFCITFIIIKNVSLQFQVFPARRTPNILRCESPEFHGPTELWYLPQWLWPVLCTNLESSFRIRVALPLYMQTNRWKCIELSIKNKIK